MKKYILVFAGILLSVADAADYYVSSTRSGRSDSNAGTAPDAPWATFGKVISEWGGLSPGDTVHLERGSQWNLSFSSDCFNMSNGGSASGGPLMLRGDDYGSGSKPILKRTGDGGSSAFFLITGSYITVRDIELDGGHYDYGKNTTGMLILADGSNVSNVQILNMRLHNLGGSTNIYTCGIWLASWTGHTTADCLIEGNEVSDYAAHGLNHYSQGRMINVVWRNNYVHNDFSGGRYLSANSALQITSGGRDCVFESNWLEDTTTTEGCFFGFGKYADDTGLNTFRNNFITGSSMYGMIFTVDYSNSKLLYDVSGNIFVNNAEAGFAIQSYDSYASGTVFHVCSNTFYNNATAGNGSRSEVEIDPYDSNTVIHLENNLVVHRNLGDTGLAIDTEFFLAAICHGDPVDGLDGFGGSSTMDDPGDWSVVTGSVQSVTNRHGSTGMISAAGGSNLWTVEYVSSRFLQSNAVYGLMVRVGSWGSAPEPGSEFRMAVGYVDPEWHELTSRVFAAEIEGEIAPLTNGYYETIEFTNTLPISKNIAVRIGCAGTPGSRFGFDTVLFTVMQNDYDADGLPDGWEFDHGLNPRDNGALNPDNGNLGDPDGDGLENLSEYRWGTQPLNADTDGDSFRDGLEAAHAGSPLVSDLWRVDYIRSHGSDYNLYSSNAVLDISIGQIAFAVSNEVAWLSLQLEKSKDLITWTNAGDEMIWSRPVETNKMFFRVRSGR
ncbi:MAG TPA: hypothetical protein VJ904_05810 [Tichowtungia sp.]|nr:hypothetical protein [Tichowtungia sp.]